MLPHGSYLSYQTLPNPRQYQFDLKVNVDFNSGKVNLGVPQPAQAFAKKQQVPVYTSPPRMPYQYPNNSYINTSHPQMINSYHQLPLQPPMRNYVTNDQVYASAHNSYPNQYSDIIRFSGNQHVKSANDTYPQTFSSFSYNMEKSMDAVNCVICDKPINRQRFHDHLEEHKGRKKDYARNQLRINNQPNPKMNSFSIRNQIQTGNVKDIYRQHPSRNSASLQPKDVSSSRRQQHPNNSISLSREISDTHSRIVYAPRDPSQIVSGNNSLSEFNYSKSSGFEQPNSRMVNQSGRGQAPPKEQQLSYPSLSLQNLSQGQNNYSNMANPGLNPSNRSNSMNQLPNQFARRQQMQRSRSSDRRLRPNLAQSTNQHQNMYSSRSDPRNNIYSLNLTESKVVRTGEPFMGLQDCDQSAINHLNNLSRFSKMSSMGEIKKQLKIHQIEEQDSSDDEQLYYSLKPSVNRRAYTSMDPSRFLSKMESSKLSNGLNRTKLPLNYLAVQEFIQNPMYYSCYRSTHRR